MGSGTTELKGPDLAAAGVRAEDVREGSPVLGHADGSPVLVARVGGELCAVSASCPHYGGPLAEGLQVGGEIRCPWHHAAFDLRSGRMTRAPALNGLACFSVEVRDGVARVTGKKDAPEPRPAGGPSSVVIVGGGAAGLAAAETLRSEGYRGPVTIISADASAPYDRPNASKDYLAGNAPEEWMPLRPPEFYAEKKLELRTSTRVVAIDPKARTVSLSDGSSLSFGALLLATGAEPVRLSIPGAERISYLRTLADSRAIIAQAKSGSHAVVLGASFIGLEAAAALRARGVEVEVAAPEAVPLERILGREVGAFLRSVHEKNGVRFHLGRTAKEVRAGTVVLDDGSELKADLVVAGIGVRPSLELAEKAGLAVDRGVNVDPFLETSVGGIFAAGDLARWPDPHSGQPVRVEHWVVAQRQGQTAARNLLGRREKFTAVPFFWTVQFGVTLNYVGHALKWDRVELDGSLEKGDCSVRYVLGDKTVALLTVGRDLESLKMEERMERAVAV